MPMMKTQDLNTKIITKKPKNARNCESRASRGHQDAERPAGGAAQGTGRGDGAQPGTGAGAGVNSPARVGI